MPFGKDKLFLFHYWTFKSYECSVARRVIAIGKRYGIIHLKDAKAEMSGGLQIMEDITGHNITVPQSSLYKQQ